LDEKGERSRESPRREMKAFPPKMCIVGIAGPRESVSTCGLGFQEGMLKDLGGNVTHLDWGERNIAREVIQD